MGIRGFLAGQCATPNACLAVAHSDTQTLNQCGCLQSDVSANCVLEKLDQANVHSRKKFDLFDSRYAVEPYIKVSILYFTNYTLSLFLFSKH